MTHHTRRSFFLLLFWVAVGSAVFSLVSCGSNQPSGPVTSVKSVRFGVSPFQDTLIPIVGQEKGWYKDVGLDVKFSVLGWTEVMEALSAGQIDVAINNETSVVATHGKNSDIVYWYGLNPFDSGFALMIRPNGPLRTLQQVEKQVGDHAAAVKQVAAQLKGRTVVTTSKTDMEQGVAAAARKGGLDFQKDIRIINLNPEDGLAAFLRGEGDAYIGGIPQRTAADKAGMVEMLTGTDLGPAPINGFVTTKKYATEHEAALVGLLHVWFQTVNYINTDMADGAAPIIRKLNESAGGKFNLEDFKHSWNVYEHYPASPKEVQMLILDPGGRNYWRARWDDCNQYFVEVTKAIPSPVPPDDAFWMERAQKAYIAKYSSQ
jgi:NitT/TauT family transport system substrate-binding protein